MSERDHSATNHAGSGAWWTRGNFLERVVTDLLAAELGRMRPGRPPPAAPWALDVEFVRDLGADSLDLMGLGTALVDTLHLDAGIDERLLARPRPADWVEIARAGLDACGSALTFRTSGSSGDPKRCTHALATLGQEAEALAALVPGRRRILSAVPSHHIYGFLFTVLLPQRLGELAVIDIRQAAPSALAGLVRAGDLIVAHPAWWEAAARCAPAFAADVVGVTSTAPCPDAFADALAAAGLRLLQVYGSSETAGVGWREGADTPFALLPHWTRADERDALLRMLPDGSTRCYPLQDRLDWTDTRHFLPAGRIDAAVQVGGTNVFPAYVADVLAQHPDVREAAVRLMRPDEGRRLKAYVVARRGADIDALRAGLPAWVRQRLAPPECPVAWTFGPRLPRQASGKPADWIIDAVP
jgi:long-chain acyl-CoA synthetase